MFNNAESLLVWEKGLVTVSQLYDMGDSGTTIRALKPELRQMFALHPLLYHKLRTLQHQKNALRLPLFNKSPMDRTNSQLCFPLSNLSKLNRTVDRAEADEQIAIAPSYQTRQRDISRRP